MIRRVRFLENMIVTMLSGHRSTAPFGMNGGQPGKRGENSVIRADGSVEILPGNTEIEVTPGDVFVIKTPGGGGFGVES